ncbi:hypothetical protein FRE64_05200 [Euhalothece natronophila Z-M001]|uniref:Uncharacterized protein n=1 Tax=Euhalothece natronophila Z-M001 TaxID=522448 RepID=A0A5B8NK72_9CHRO|nr:hypothetical protein [Euhalothece natronophila]QDZ39376.1 hypothetical protein FRE64_05200 [Euhalothece natronophila Z-M001]
MLPRAKKFPRLFLLIIVTFIITVLGAIPLQIMLTYLQVPEPEAILVLSCNRDRHRTASELA